MRKPATFVLVHGAWAGAWAVTRIADRLTAKGHRVYAPTLSGLGERSHLAACGINLTTHVNDIVNEITWKIRERIASIVYVDAFIPADGQSFADITGWNPDGAMVAPPAMPEDAFANEADQAWVTSKATPQPTATLKEGLRITGAYQRVAKKVYVRATGWARPFAALAHTLKSDPGWTVIEIDCGHDVANLRPDELTAILDAST